MKTTKYLFLLSALALSMHNGKAQTPIKGITLNPCVFPFDQDDFSNPSAWTLVDAAQNNGNGTIQIASNMAYFSAADAPGCTGNNQMGACDNRELRIYRNLAGTLSNSSWRAQCQFEIDNGNGITHMLMGITAGTQDPQGTNNPGGLVWSCGAGPGNTSANYADDNQDGIFASIISFGTDQYPSSNNSSPFPGSYLSSYNYAANFGSGQHLGWRIFGHAKCGAKVVAHTETYYPSISQVYPAEIPGAPQPPLNWSRGILLPNIGMPYYIRLERLNAGKCRISVFSDAAMTVHVPGSPQCFDIDPAIANLHTVQNGTSPSGSCLRSATGYITNFVIYNGCPGIPDFNLSASASSSCPGSTATLTATPGFTNYTWNPGGINTGNTNTLAVNPTSTTVYTVTADYTGYGADCPFSATTTVTVSNPYPTMDPSFSLSGNLPASSNYFTVNATPTLSNSTISSYGPGYGYLWNVDVVDNTTGVVYSTISNPSNWWNSLSSNTFPGYSSTSTGASSDNTSITTGSGSFYQGFKYRITRGVWNPCTYYSSTKSIMLCNGCRSEDGGPVFVVVDENSDSSYVGTKPTGTFNVTSSERNIAVRPNPSTGIFNISIGNSASGRIEVYDIVGRLVKSMDLNGSSTEIKLDLSDSPKGLYILNMVIDGSTYSQKLILE